MVRLDRLALAALLISCGGDASSDDGWTPEVKSQLVQASKEMAQQLAVAAPSTMIAVSAPDHAAAEALISGAVLNEHDPVYIVQMTGGEFTALHHPYGQEAPHGSVLTVSYDAKTMRVVDVGFDTVAPDLHAIDANVVDLMANP